MGTRQYAITNFNGAYGSGIATINAWLTIKNLATHDLCFNLKQEITNFDFIHLTLSS